MSTGTSAGYLETKVFWEGHTHLDFDKRQIRKAMRKIGADVRKEGRRMVARKAVSAPGEDPGRQTGRLMKSIKYKVSRPGLLVRIAPEKTEGMKEFYPAFLGYGVRRSRDAKAAKSHKKQPEGPYKLAPRANYMETALENRKQQARETLANALLDALIARK